MSKNKMLIDAAHPEETRVVVLRNGRVEEFDYESAARKLLRGNIYLAKVTRVEPSLQAAFVDYGGNRHGFLAFSEIHPDYYQIPVADRELLKQEEAEAEAEAEAAAEARAERRTRQQEDRRTRKAASAASQAEAKAIAASAGGGNENAVAEEPEQTPSDNATSQDADSAETAGAGSEPRHSSLFRPAGPAQTGDPDNAGGADDAPHAIGLVEDQVVLDEPVADESNGAAGDDAGAGADHDGASAHDAGGDEDDDGNGDGDDDGNGSETELVEEVGSEDAMEEIARRPRRRARQYKIQEVIKRRQVLLVQVVKEERGNKGAALTTYLSLAGRYTVLMPNTGRGGGISRKITNAPDRKRLKSIADGLDVPEGMGLIIRTAGAARTKPEIKRDFEYLLRLWESVRELTLDSSAPNLVYEEGNLIKRSIRDLYSKDVDEILVAGERAHADAREFMGMMMPSHARHVVRYKEPEPLFAKHQIERQLNAMFSPYVTLKSGGYIVINQTEALVSVDVNSGKATREFSIEETALKTNLEAADELGRQLKLRDLAGLIVIDFIDMEERRNNRAVERKIKDCLKNDRARVQVGRISHFGLLEMSRQRMRTGVLEGSTTQCQHCTGTGVIRSTESVALGVLRALEDALLSNARQSLTAVTTSEVALYILNLKRAFINEMEERYDVAITVEANERMQGANFAIEKSAIQAVPQKPAERTAVNMEWGFEGDEKAQVPAVAAADGGGNEERDGQKPTRRRRRGRGARGEAATGVQRAASGNAASGNAGGGDAGGGDAGGDNKARAQTAGADIDTGGDDGAAAENPASAAGAATGEADERPRPRRRRGRRGGRRTRERSANGQAQASNEIPGSGEQPAIGTIAGNDGTPPATLPGESFRETGKSASAAKEKPVRKRPKADRQPAPAAAKPEPPKQAAEKAAAEPAKKETSRKGWWQRAFSSD